MADTTISQSPSLLVSATLFWASSLAMLLFSRRRKNEEYVGPSKASVWKMRQRFFSTSLSVSYSNSDPLMMVEVRRRC